MCIPTLENGTGVGGGNAVAQLDEALGREILFSIPKGSLGFFIDSTCNRDESQGNLLWGVKAAGA
jgi:hypothetical protein